jgi:NAD(P)H dehydrogenase (quinone)
VSETSGRSDFRHLLILANPSEGSFDHAIAETYVETVRASGQEIVVRDLYAMGFDPLLKAHERPGQGPWSPADDVATEIDALSAADVIVFVYPIWFGLPPAILKGYVDRVLGAGYTVDDMRQSTGQATVEGKPLISFTTSGAPLPWLRDQGQMMGLKEVFDVYLWRGLAMSRIEHIRIDNITPGMEHDYALQQLGRVRKEAEECCEMLASGHYRREWEAERTRRERRGLG